MSLRIFRSLRDAQIKDHIMYSTKLITSENISCRRKFLITSGGIFRQARVFESARLFQVSAQKPCFKRLYIRNRKIHLIRSLISIPFLQNCYSSGISSRSGGSMFHKNWTIEKNYQLGVHQDPSSINPQMV